MNDKKERVYSEEDLCEYTILQKIDELEKQLKNIKNEFNGMYETKEAADSIHRLLRSNDAKINNRIDGLYNITPTDVGVKNNKLGLLHDTTWLTNQDAINIGDGLSYDEATKTLKASGGGGGGASKIIISSVLKSKKAYISKGTYYSNKPIKLNFDNYPWLDANILPPIVITTTATCKDNTGAEITLIVYLYKYNNYKLGLTLIPTQEFTVDSLVYTDYDIQWEEPHITIA